MSIERRTFVKLGGLAALGLVGADAVASGPRPATSGADAAPPRPATAARRWAIVVDTSVCLRGEGCTGCTDACHRAHNVPAFPNAKDEVKWLWKEPFVEALPDERHAYLPASLASGQVLVMCNHCDEPACTRVCPTGATWKREDGVVMMDWHRCIGCRYCIAACPYGSRSFNWRDPRPFVAHADPAFPTRTRGVVEKCNLCEERLAEGRPPACVEGCPSKALLVGDLEDPDSEVRQRLAARPALRRRAALGTQPQVYYLL
jgi:molybdopterin-containing oxidoreductase family iron-sulfur binding subunit